MLDTNLFVAAFWNRRSASADILRACLDGRVRPCYSMQMRRELSLILRNVRATEWYKDQVNRILAQGAEVSTPGELRAVREDPEDDKFLECAMLAGAPYLVTNDEHLLGFREFEGARIVKPSEFRRVLAKR